MQFLHSAAAALAMRLTVCVTVCLTVSISAAQQAPKPPTGAPTTTSPGTNPSVFNPSATNPTLNTPGGSSSRNFPAIRRIPLFLTGKVTFQDGSEVGQPVLIERVCTGRPRPEGYTDAKGNFSLHLGQEMDVVADASESQGRNPTSAPGTGGVRDSQLAVCELRAVLSGYRSETIQLGSRKYMDNPDVGIIVLRPMVAVEEAGQ